MLAFCRGTLRTMCARIPKRIESFPDARASIGRRLIAARAPPVRPSPPLPLSVWMQVREVKTSTRSRLPHRPMGKSAYKTSTLTISGRTHLHVGRTQPEVCRAQGSVGRSAPKSGRTPPPFFCVVEVGHFGRTVRGFPEAGASSVGSGTQIWSRPDPRIGRTKPRFSRIRPKLGRTQRPSLGPP